MVILLVQKFGSRVGFFWEPFPYLLRLLLGDSVQDREKMEKSFSKSVILSFRIV